MTKNRTVIRRAALVLLLGVPLLGLFNTAAAQDAQTSDAYQKSYEFEAAGTYREALDALRQAGSDERSEYVYALRSGWLLYNSGEYANAIKAYEKAASRQPKAIEPLAGMMLPQMALRRWKDAVDTAQKGLDVDPNNYLINSRLAYSLYNLGRYADAESRYRRVLELYPSDADMRSGLAWSLLKQGDTAAARRQFQRVLEIAPKSESAKEGLRQAEQ